MPTVKYTGNASPRDGTAALKLENDEETGQPRFLRIGGPPMEISDEELALVSGAHQLETVDEESAPDPAEVPTGPIVSGTLTEAQAQATPPLARSMSFPPSTDPPTPSEGS